jgi:hypothetical protein
MNLREIFNKQMIAEGGNLSLPGGHEAQQIDLKVHNRGYIVPILNNLLLSINNSYAQAYGTALWSSKVLKSQEFLSGSSLHFFNTDIPDDEFVRVKPKVGDIDTQVNKDAEPNIEQWLNSIQGKVVGPAKFLGFQRGNEQFSSLWEFTDPPMKIQIDLEFVAYDKDKPTDWSKFSHSSSWEDLGAGIKGVFHKYLIQSFTTLTSQEFLLRKLVGRGKARTEQDVKMRDNMFSFAVSSKEGGGLRAKYEPVIDQASNPLVINGLPVMRALPAEGYEQDLTKMFMTLFGDRVSKPQLKKMMPKVWSFTGLLDLMNEIFSPEEKQQVVNSFVEKLFSKGAQGLYKNDPDRDITEKNVALKQMITKLQVPAPSNLEQMRQDYKVNYRMTNEGPMGLDAPLEEETGQVQAQLRKGMPHLKDLKPADFFDLLDELHDGNGNFKLENIPLNVKVDGFGGRFGKNSTGRPFMGTSRTEPRYEAGFVAYHQKKGTTDPEILGRAELFDQLFNEMMNAIKIVDSKLGKDFLINKQVTCEVLYLPFATETPEGKLKFVGIHYDKLPRGVQLALVPFRVVDADTGSDIPNSNEFIKELTKLGKNGSVMFIDNSLKQKEALDVTAIVPPLENIEQFKAMLASGKRADKQEVIAAIAPIKLALEKAIIEDPNIVGKDLLGQNYEGIVINSRLGPIKITSQEQRDVIQAKQDAMANARVERPRENENKTAVVAIGSFVGHVGHEQLWDYTIKKAKEVGGDPYLFIGNAEGKDDPIPPSVKVQTWHKMYPQYAKNISTVTQQGGSLMQKIKHELINPLPEKPPRYDNIIIMVGEDQAGMNIASALMKAVNKFQGYEHVKVTLEATPRGTGMSFTKLRNILKDPKATPEQQLQVWSQGFDVSKLGTDWIKHLMDITRKGMGIQMPQQKTPPTAPVAERLFNALVRPQINENQEKQYHGWSEFEDELLAKSNKALEYLHEVNPALFSRYGTEYIIKIAEKVALANPEFRVMQIAGEIIRTLKSEVDEARMSNAVKLQRAWEREQAKSAASRKRGEELLNPPKKEEPKKDQGVAEDSEPDAYGRTGEKHECGSCDGTGIISYDELAKAVEYDDVCPECGGKGWVRDKELLKKKGVAEGLNEFSMGDDGEDPTDNYPCYDCGSTIFLHHTKLCDLAEDNAIRDLPAKPGSQHWTGQIPKGLSPIPGLQEGVAKGNLKEFAPGSGGGESGRWYTDDQMTDIVGDGWWNDLDVSGASIGVPDSRVPKKYMIQQAQAWLDDQGYSVRVLNCKLNDDDMDWFIEGSFHNPGFAKKGVAEGPEAFDPLKGIKALLTLEKQYADGSIGTYDELMKKLGNHEQWTNVVGHNLKKTVPGFTIDDFWTLDDIVRDLSDGYGLPEWFRIINDGGWKNLIEKYKQYMAQRQGQSVNEQGVAEGSSGAKYKVKIIGKDKKGDYYVSPSTGEKVYKKANVGDHEVPGSKEIKPKVAEAGSPAQQAAIAINMKKHHKKPKSEAMLPKSAFAGSDKNKLGTAGQWKNTGPSKNRPARAGDLVGGAEESIELEEKQRLDPKCWKGYRKAGTKMKGGVRVNNCVPISENVQDIMDALINKIIVNEAISNNKR